MNIYRITKSRGISNELWSKLRSILRKNDKYYRDSFNAWEGRVLYTRDSALKGATTQEIINYIKVKEVEIKLDNVRLNNGIR